MEKEFLRNENDKLSLSGKSGIAESAEKDTGFKRGLVMEGGSMRGLFTCGVIDVFLENNINFDGAVGTSAGATFGCNFKSRQKGRVLRYALKYCRDYRFGSIRSLLKTGDVFDVRFCYDDIPWHLDLWDADAFRDNPMEFYAVASDIQTGKPVYFRLDKGEREDVRAIQASASMPLFSNIVEINGRKFLDGGVTDSIALRFMQKMGYSKNVVILTKPRGYVRKPDPMLRLIRLRYRKYPKLVEACENRHKVYNATLKLIANEEAAGRVLVIAPSQDLAVGRLESDPKKLKKAYDMGRSEALKSLAAIREGGF